MKSEIFIRLFSLNILNNIIQRFWLVSGTVLCLSPRARLVVAAVAVWLSKGCGKGRHAPAHLAQKRVKEKEKETDDRSEKVDELEKSRPNARDRKRGRPRLVLHVWMQRSSLCAECGWEQVGDSSQAFPCFHSVWLTPALHSCHCSARLEEASAVFW